MSDTDAVNQQPGEDGHSPDRPIQNQTPHNCKHLNSDYSQNLDRDDSLWPLYVKEAENWDNIMIEKWNRSMDALLLFATLFSAIVTAFVVESSEKLQPDHSAISARALIEIAQTLRSSTNGEQTIQNSTITLAALDEFEPSANQFLANLAWFVSLCLSVTVALLASLVKQWCTSFISDRTAPPCNQARIRQARFNKLVSWQTGLIVSALPVIMHAALGLFLFGLIVFLQELNHPIYLATLIIAGATATFYIGTTIIPLFIPFCPYETPLSSHKAWGYFFRACQALTTYFYRLFVDPNIRARPTNYRLPCDQQEWNISNNTTPDEVTGDALNWIIIHSQHTDTQEMAIRAIAGLQSDQTLERLVAKPPGIFPQVVQSFTACFTSRSSGQGEDYLELRKPIDDVSLHGKALTALVRLENIAFDRLSSDLDPLAKWRVDDVTKKAVMDRFMWLSQTDECPHGKTLGLIGLSAWNDFIGRKEPRFNRGNLVEELSKSLQSYWLSDTAPGRPITLSMPSDLCEEILHSIMIESVYWAPSVEGARRANILNLLVGLIPTNSGSELRGKLACSLVVLTLGLNRGSTHLAQPQSSNCVDAEAGVGETLAKKVAYFYAKNPGRVVRDEQALLLLALTGLMEHYQHCNFDDENQENMMVVAKRLLTLDSLEKSNSITLPEGTGLNFDIRAYFVEILVLHFSRAPTPSQSRVINEVSVHLLKSVKHKRALWVDHGSVIALPIVQTLGQTDSIELKSECLSAIIINWDTKSSAWYLRLLLSYDVPLRLVRSIKSLKDRPSSSDSERRQSMIFRSAVHTTFENIANDETVIDEEPAAKGMIKGKYYALFFETILQEDLLETFVRDALNLAVTPRTSSHYEPGEVNMVQSERFPRPVALYDETREYLKARAAQRKSGEEITIKDAFLLELFASLRGKLSIEKWKSRRATNQSEASTSAGNTRGAPASADLQPRDGA